MRGKQLQVDVWVVFVKKVLTLLILMIVLFSYYKLAWEPIVDQVAHSYSHRLPALCRKLRFWLFFHITGNPLNLESKLITFPWFSRVLQSKLEGNRWRGSRVMIGQTNKQTNSELYYFIYINSYYYRDTRVQSHAGNLVPEELSPPLV